MNVSSAPACYEFRIEGHLDQRWSTWFDGLAITHEDDGTTTLRGAVTDQAGLHGLFAKIRDLGLTLISVVPRGTHDGGSDGRHHRPAAPE